MSLQRSKNNNVGMVKKLLDLIVILASVYCVTSTSWQSISFIQASFLSSLVSGRGHDKWNIKLQMPNIRADYDDQYLCMAHLIAKQREGDKQQWITGFKPIANSSRIHHIILYSCEVPGIYQPGTPKFVWDCSGMEAQAGRFSSFENGPVCRGKEQIIYGWALDAGELELPHGVGFRVGPGSGDSSTTFLVLQVHYHGPPGNHDKPHDSHHQEMHSDQSSPQLMPIDNSGLILKMQSKGITKSAGVLLMSSTGYIEPGLSKHEILCQLDSKDAAELHPIYYRTHTHKLGYKVSGGKLIDKRTYNAYGQLELQVFQIDLIGERNPQEPQMFYPVVRSDMVIGPGDNIYAACFYNQTNPWPIKIGATSDDEMCNFYMMYWTDGPQSINQKTCVSANPPGVFDEN